MNSRAFRGGGGYLFTPWFGMEAMSDLHHTSVGLNRRGHHRTKYGEK